MSRPGVCNEEPSDRLCVFSRIDADFRADVRESSNHNADPKAKLNSWEWPTMPLVHLHIKFARHSWEKLQNSCAQLNDPVDVWR